MTTNVGELSIKLSFDSKSLQSSQSEVESKTKSMGTAMQTTFGVLAANAISGVTSKVGGLVKSTIEVGKAFEKSMSNVAAISGATGADLEALTAKAQEMGRNTVWSASDAADAMSYMAMAGWKTSDMLDGIAGIMDLATAAGADLATTSDIVTDALTAFGLSAADSGRLADVMAAASSNANTNVGLMGETFKYAAPVAGALGYSIEDTAVAIGLMANAGIKGSQAGTSLRSMFTRLSAPTKEVSDAMNALGISITETDGTMKPLSKVMGELRNSFRKLNPEQQASYAKAIAGQEAMSGLLSVVNASDDDFNKLTKAVANSNGAAAEMAAIMGDNLEGKLAALQAKVQDLQIKAFKALEPVINAVVDALSWCADHADILIPIVGALTTAFVAWKIATLELNASLLANPIGLIVSAIAGLIAGVVLLWNNCEGFRNFVMGAIDAIGAAIGAVGEFIGGVVNGIIDWFAQAGEFIGNVFNTIGETATAIFQAIWDFISPIVNLLVQAFQNWWNVVSAIFNAIWNIAKSVFDLVWSLVSTIIGNIVTTFQNLWQIVSAIFNAVWNIAKTVFDAIWSIVSTIIGNIVTTFQNLWQIISSIFTAVWNKVSSVFQNVWNTVSGVVNNIRSAFQNAWNFVTGIFGKVGSWFRDRFTEAFNAIKNVFSGITGFFQGIWDKVTGIFKAVGTTIGNAISGTFKAVVNGVLSTVENVLNGPIRAINGLIDVINAIPGIELGHLSEFNLPRMAQGGIVPGTSYSGDHNMIMANSGEMVITRSQQAELWTMIESGNYGYDEESEGGSGYDGRKVEIIQNNTIANGFDVEQMNQAMLAAMRGV